MGIIDTAEIGRKGGSVTSDAKAEAARANGTKGGRPRATFMARDYSKDAKWQVSDIASRPLVANMPAANHGLVYLFLEEAQRDAWVAAGDEREAIETLPQGYAGNMSRVVKSTWHWVCPQCGDSIGRNVSQPWCDNPRCKSALGRLEHMLPE